MMKRILALSLLLLMITVAASAAYGQEASAANHIDPWFKPTTVTFKDTPLPEAIEQLTKDIGVDYKFTQIATDPAELKVTAVFRNVPLEAALKQTISSSGLAYTRYDNSISIYDPGWMSNSARAGQTANVKDYWQETAQASFQNLRFADAVKKLFDGTPATFSIPADVAEVKVSYDSSFLRGGGYSGGALGTSRAQALGGICESANVRYTIEGDKITFELGRPGSGAYMKNGRLTVHQSFSNTSFPETIRRLFYGTKTVYRIKPGLEEVKVNANLGEMPLDDALKHVLDSAGATYKKEGETYVFSPATGQAASVKRAANSAQTAAAPKRQTDQFGQFPEHPNYMTSDNIPLRYVDASAVLPLAQLQPDLRVARTGPRFVAVYGRPAAIKEFRDVVAIMDRQESLPRAVRVTVTGRITADVGGGNPQVRVLTTDHLTPEGMRASANTIVADRLEVRAKEALEHEDPLSAVKAERGNTLSVSFIPTIIDARPEDKTPTTISLFGNGVISGDWPISFSRTFDILASLTPKKEAAITSGSIITDGLTFTITAVADIEPGRVQLPTGLQNDPNYLGYGSQVNNLADPTAALSPQARQQYQQLLKPQESQQQQEPQNQGK